MCCFFLYKQPSFVLFLCISLNCFPLVVLRNNWSDYHPHTNVLWLHYLCSKLLSMKYRTGGGKAAKDARKTLSRFHESVLQYGSATEALRDSPLFRWPPSPFSQQSARPYVRCCAFPTVPTRRISSYRSLTRPSWRNKVAACPVWTEPPSYVDD